MNEREKAAELRCETRAVLAGAYKGRLGDRSMLTHSVIVWADGTPVTVLCRSVALASLADPHASDVNAAPTCDRCRASDRRAAGRAP